MLRSTRGDQTARIGRRVRTRTYCERVTFGGLAFELLGSGPLQHDLDGTDRRFLVPGADPRAMADVVCAVHVKPPAPDSQPAPLSNAIHFCADAATGVTRVWSRELEAEVSRVAPRRYAVDARIGSRPETLVGLLRSVTGAIVHAEGGLMLHAVGIELDGRAVLFLGPSGAGKSTAAVLADGARCFAHDHVAVVPSGRGYLVWGLPGGTPAQVPLARDVAYPLAAALRVRKAAASEQPRALRLAGAQALFSLRESVECADQSPAAEDMYLRASAKLSSDIDVGALATVLGRPHGSTLREWLRARMAERIAREEQSTC